MEKFAAYKNVLVLLLVLSFLDIYLLMDFLEEDVSRASFSGMHAGLTVFALVAWWKSALPRRFSPVFGMVLGPVGLFAGIALPPVLKIVLLPWLSRQGSRTSRLGPEKQAWDQTPDMQLLNRLLDDRIHHPEPRVLGSLMVVMRAGSIEARSKALATVVRTFDPRLSKIVLLALNDPDQTIRALAAATASQVAHIIADDREILNSRNKSDTVRALACERLLHHARYNVLLSQMQRKSLLHEAQALSAAMQEHDGSTVAECAIEQAWGAKDFARLDRIAPPADANTSASRVFGALTWWQSHQSLQKAV
jgi:hypothetical protein